MVDMMPRPHIRSRAKAIARAAMQLLRRSSSTAAAAAAAKTAAATSTATSTATFADGRLVVSGGGGKVEVVSIPENEILFIVKDDAGGGGDAYRVARLREHVTEAAAAPTPDGNDADGVPPPPPPPNSVRYEFATARLRERDVQQLPRAFLDRYLLAKTPLVLPSASSSSLHVVVSTGSGLGQAEPFYDSVLGPLLRDVFGLTAVRVGTTTASRDATEKHYSLLVTDSKESITTFARTLRASATAARLPAPTVILLSGDGGVVDLLNGVDSGANKKSDNDHNRNPTIALLPLGTGNALFHSLHKPAYEAAAASSGAVPPPPSPLVHGLRTLFHGRAAPLPSFEAMFAPGSHTVADGSTSVERLRGAIVASYGFHAQLVWESDTPAYRKHGDARFGILASALVKESHAYAADVSVRRATETETVDSDMIAPAGSPAATPIGHAFNYVLATLVSELQQGFTISPASQPLDGQLRLVHFGPVGGSRTMAIMMLAYNKGVHVREGDVGYEAIDEVEIRILEEDPRWRKVCIDGTIVEIPQGGWMRVRKAAEPVLNIITTV